MGFILTMWYVNVIEDDLEDIARECFILTMWYVNLFDLMLQLNLLHVLY